MRCKVGFTAIAGLACLWSAIDSFADPKPKAERPQGYEKAPEANQARPAPAPAARDRTKINKARVAASKQRVLSLSTPILNKRLSFVNTVCSLSETQRRQVSDAANRLMKAIVNDPAQAEAELAVLRNRAMGRQSARGAAQPVTTIPQKLVQTVVERIVKQNLSAEQLEIYKAELDDRAANQTRIRVINTVAKLDEVFILSGKQRDKLAKSLSSNWQPQWARTYETLLKDDRFIFNIPDRFIVPFLNEPQTAAWHRMRTGNDAPPAEGSIGPVHVERAVVIRNGGAVALRMIGPNGRIEVATISDQAQALDPWFFGPGQTARQVRERLASLLALQVDSFDRASQLSDAQRQKLKLAGRGDINEFFDRLDELREKLRQVSQQPDAVNAVFKQAALLRTQADAGFFGETSLFHKVAMHTLDPRQAAGIARARRERKQYRYEARVILTVAIIGDDVPLRAAQRQQLEKLIIQETELPEKFGPEDHQVVLVKLAEIPNEKLKPIFDDLQWPTLLGYRRAAARVAPGLRNEKYLP